MDRPRYRELAPDRLPVPLRGLVECGWRAEVPAGAAGHTQRVLPDGCMDLLLIEGRVVVAGPDTAAQLAAQVPGSPVTGLRFRPGRLPTLLGVPAEALRDQRVELADLSPRTRRLAAGSGAGADPVAASGPSPAAGDLHALVALALALRADPPAGPAAGPPLPGPALGLLGRGATAAEVAEVLGCTTRTLHRRCRAGLGYGPATARRILRFRAATDLLHAGVPAAEAAARTGYADQPHLSREVRSLAGVSPGELTGAGAAQAQANRSSDEPSGSRTVA